MSVFHILAKGKPLLLKPGIYESMPREEYDRIPYFNQSVLKKWCALATRFDPMTNQRDFHYCPAKFKRWFDQRHIDNPSYPMIIGSALDCVMLDTPEDFAKKFTVLPPDAPKRPSKLMLKAKNPSAETLRAIAFWGEFNANADGKRILAAEDLDLVKAMAAAIRADQATAKVMQNCRKVVLIADLHGFLCKAELDLFTEMTPFIFDLKVTDDVSEDAFRRTAWKLHYPDQAGWYLAIARELGLVKKNFTFIAVEDEAPHFVNTPTLVWEDNTVQYGLQQLTKAMHALAEYLERDEWPSYKPFQTLSFARYAENEAVFGLEKEAA